MIEAERMHLRRQLFFDLLRNPLNWLVIALPLALAAHWGNWGELWVFLLSAVGVIPMAGWIGEATEAIAVYTGPKIGGLLNATLGNAAELIITLTAIRAGLLELVKASITGSILGNLLLVLGFAMVFGGVKYGVQKFDKRHVGQQAVLLTLSIVAMVIPSLFSHSIGSGAEGSARVEALSLGVAGVMIILYGFGIFYSLRVAHSPITYSEEAPKPKAHSAPTQSWSVSTAIVILVIATLGVVVLSELLVGSVEPVVRQLGLSEFFLGIILIPIIGNVAEHLVAVQVALKNHMELSVEIAVSSSLQIALFVAPLLVFISLFMGHPLTLILNQFELLALGAGVLIASLVSSDGESNWLEGISLLAVYVILGIAFFLMPA
jgi:Ca2+:H+ antiporter